MQYETRKVADLIPYVNNARTHSDSQVTQLASSIKEFGFINPVIIDDHNGLIAGHGRLMAAKKLGLEEVPVLVESHLTEAQKKAYILADNKLALNAGWDADLLKVELSELKDLGFDNLDTIGFSEDEIKDILNTELEAVEDNGAGAVPEEPKSQRGDIWILGAHRLMCGDSTSENDVKALMQDEKADIVFTDPPYGINVVSADGTVGTDFGIAKQGKYKQVLADDTTETAQKAYEVFSKFCDKKIIWGGNYFLSFLPLSDSWIIWDKRCESGIKNTFADAEMAWCSFHTPVRVYHQLWNGMIREGEHEKRVHPTQKPIKMLGEILKDFTKESDIILDCFGGSGSTLIACEQLQRKCRMMELDEHYCDIICQRYKKLTGQEAVRVDGVKFSEV